MDIGEGQFFRSVTGRGPGLSASADGEIASGMVRRAEDLEAKRKQRAVRDVRPGLARRIGVTAGTLRNVRKNRKKIIPAWLMASIRSVLVDVLQAEIRALEHEVHLALQAGVGHRDDALAHAQAQVAKAREALMEAVR